MYADGRAAIAYLRGRGVPARRIALYGESLGTGVAVKMAVEHEVGAVILEAPFTSAVDVGARAYPILPVRWLMKDRYESLGHIAGAGHDDLRAHGADAAILRFLAAIFPSE